MVSEENLKRDRMYYEGSDRLHLLGVSSVDQWGFLKERKLTKSHVNHKELSIRREEITDDEMKMIRDFEEKFKSIVYYVIQDEGMWPDGETFERYSLLYVDENEEEYESTREDCIIFCGTVPAYVINMEEPDCSELTEFKFENVEGLLINAS